MAKKVILSVFALLSIGLLTFVLAADPQPPASVPLPAGASAWKLILNENFDSTAYDTSRWNPYADWGGAGSFNSGRENYYPSQIQVSNGICHLVAQPNPGVTAFANSYKSGELLSARANTNATTPYKFSFLYGYAEARLKIVSKSGFFGAFWMLPDKKNFNYEWEIDILEQLGNDHRTMFQTYNYYPGLPLDSSRNASWTPNKGGGNNGNAPVIDYSTAYHTVGVDWQTNHLTFYIDGIASGTFPTPGANNANIPRTPGYIIIQQMVENSWCRQPMFACTLSNAATSTDTFDIDYVRVWQGTNNSGIRQENTAAAPKGNLQAFVSSPVRGQMAFSVSRAGRSVNAIVRIFDGQGRLVSRLSGSNPSWNGNDGQGEGVRTGLYFYSVDCAGAEQTGEFTYVR
jgi:beta-glucanase (GH16 family)